MKKFRNLLTLLAFLTVGLFMAVGSNSTQAATSNSGNGMRVSPVRTDLVINPGESKTISVYVQNVTDGDATYRVLQNDFIAGQNETGTPALLLNGETNDRHGLKEYMSSVDTVSVPAGEQKEVKVTIDIPAGTAGGGYYGAVRFAPQSSDAENVNVSLSGSVASLVLVRVPGDVVEKMSLESFDARKDGVPHVVFTSGKNILAVARMGNEGNVQLQPFGTILVKKGGEVIDTYEVNSDDQPGNVLPDSIRRFDVPIDNVGSFGKYTLVGSFGYGNSGQVMTGETTFYVVPLPMILLAVFLILLALFLIFGLPKIIRSYNRSVIRKASRRK